MRRREAYLKRIEAAYQEFHAASAAVGLLEERLRADPSYLSTRVPRNRVASDLRGHLEGTYLIRLFAVFEAGSGTSV